jgi:hypothetical protein
MAFHFTIQSAAWGNFDYRIAWKLWSLVEDVIFSLLFSCARDLAEFLFKEELYGLL